MDSIINTEYSKTWEEIVENYKSAHEDEKLCAACYKKIKRDEYSAHLRDEHGYEILEITLNEN